MSQESKSPQEPGEPTLEKGFPKVLWYFLIPSALFLIWALFFKAH